MPFSLITGPISSGKTSFLFDILIKDIEKGKSLYIVPSEYTAAELRQAYLNKSNRPLLGEIFVSWPHFLKLISGVKRPVMSRLHITLFLYEILKSHTLRYFKSEAVSLAIAREFAETILLLKKNLISPEILRKELETRGSLKENDLLTAYEKYEKKKQNFDIIDEGDVVSIAATNLAQKKAGTLSNIESILIDEFYEITPGLRTVLELLKNSGISNSIWMALPQTSNNDYPFAKHWNKAIEEIKTLADNNKKFTLENEVRPILQTYKARSPSAEINVITELLRKTLEEEKSLSETSIVCRSNDHYLTQLLTSCERYGLVAGNVQTLSAMHAPLVHKITGQDIVSTLPKTANIEEFVCKLGEALIDLDAFDKYRGDIKNQEIQNTASRNLLSIYELYSLLQSIKTRARTLPPAEISRESFAEFITNEISQFISIGTVNSQIPFCIRPFEIPPALTSQNTIIPHMTEGHIPKPVTGRLFFGEMDEFGDKNYTLLDDIFISAEDNLAKEAAILHAISAKTSEKIIATYPVIDQSGNECIGSSFLDLAEEPDFVDPPVELHKSIVNKSFINHIRNMINIEWERFRGSCETSEYHGFITDGTVRKMFSTRFVKDGFSPTSLERYANCPFQFFVEKVLNLKPEEEITPDILPKDRGTIIHSILENFFKNYTEDFHKAVSLKKHESVIKEIVENLVDEAFLKHATLIGYSSPSLDSYQRKAVKTLAFQVIKMELSLTRQIPAPLTPKHCEWSFGISDKVPLKLKMPDSEPVTIKGCIDRIDTDKDEKHFMIVDYKTGRSISSVKSKILNGLHLQLPLYLEAAKVLLYPNAEIVGGMLVGVQQAEKKHGILKKSYNNLHYELSTRLATVMKDEDLDEALKQSIEYVRKYVTSIRQGHFPTEPRECNSYCDYKDICRYHGKIN